MNNQQFFMALTRSILGQDRYLVVPTAIAKLLKDNDAALFLGQLVFWSDKGRDDRDGWFWKSYDEWESEINVSKYKIDKWKKEFEKFGFLETKLEKANGAPTLHYRINMDRLYEWMKDALDTSDPTDQNKPSTRNGKSNFSLSLDNQIFDKPYTEDDSVNDLLTEREIYQKSKEEDTDISSNTDSTNEEGTDLPFREEQNLEWESIGRDNESNSTDNNGGAPKSLHKYEETVKWARQHKLLDSVSDMVKTVSYVFFQETGIEPASPVSGWVKACDELWETAKHSEDALRRGLQKGEAERQKGTVTLSHPRSYKSYVVAVIARINKPDQPNVVQVIEEPNELMGDGKTDTMQKVYKNSEGQTVVRVY